jgi:hypothetical protein
MKKKIILISTIAMLFLPAFFIMSCKKAPEILPDSFTATYNLVEEGRSISISGNSDGMPGEQSEYVLKINNNAEQWEDEYYVLLVDSDSVIKEISHGQLDISGGGGIETPVMVEYPEGFEGALGLCVLVPQRGSLIATLSIGAKNAITTGWPDISTYPFLPTKKAHIAMFNNSDNSTIRRFFITARYSIMSPKVKVYLNPCRFFRQFLNYFTVATDLGFKFFLGENWVYYLIWRSS